MLWLILNITQESLKMYHTTYPTWFTLMVVLVAIKLSHTTALSSENDISKPIMCSCTDRIEDCDQANHTCVTDGVCFVSVRRNKQNLEPLETYGCIHHEDNEQWLPGLAFPLSCFPNPKISHEYGISCCRDKDFCNDNEIKPTLAPLPDDQKNQDDTSYSQPLSTLNFALIIMVPLLAITLITLMIVWLCHRRHHTSSSSSASSSSSKFAHSRFSGLLPGGGGGRDKGSEKPLLPSSIGDDSTLKSLLIDISVGSGSGLPLLVQRTIARSISLQEVVGKGRFGEVYRGRWRGEDVAVKIFPTTDERSWSREVEIYQTTMLRHEHILGFIAADNKDSGSWTQLWLVMDFEPNGSLFDYLQTHTVDVSTMFRMCRSLAAGLSHLHVEVEGTVQGKPAIAHRDLKSKNILVKSSLTCAIADLGLAVRHDSRMDRIDIPDNNRCGTRRYMAPEVLDESMNVNHFESFKRADIYSMGLVLWEVARRCTINGLIAEDYELPYFDLVPSDPTLEEMKKVVCCDKLRPAVPNKWTQIESLQLMCKVMRECWSHNAAARLTALRVKKTIDGMLSGMREDVKLSIPL